MDAVANHMRNDCAQLGAGYGTSNRATEAVSAAHRFMEACRRLLLVSLQAAQLQRAVARPGPGVQVFMNVQGQGEVMLGTATSILVSTLADTMRRSRHVQPGDEVIIQEAGHESNVGALPLRVRACCAANAVPAGGTARRCQNRWDASSAGQGILLPTC